MRSWLALAVAAAAACAPSRQELFDPVARDLRSRTGLEVAWRGGERPAEVDRAIDRLLARPLDADAAARIALLARPAVQAAFEELGASAADLAGAVAPARAEAELELRRQTGDGDASELELAVVTDLVDLATLPARRGAARAGMEAARARATRTAIDVATGARIALYRAAAAEQVLALRRTVNQAAAASTELARRLRAAGNTSALALAQEEALAEQTRLDLAAAEAVHDEAREALAAALGLAAADRRLRPVDELPDPPALPPDLAQLDAIAVERSLDLGALRWRGEAAARSLGVARWRSFFPALGIGASAQRSSESGWSVGPALRLSIPLFDWGQGERGRAWSELRRSRRLHEDAAISLRAAARAAARRLAAARERAIRLRDVLVPLRARIADETLLHYNAMRATPFELVAARQAHIDARRQYVEALRDTWIAAALVDRLRAGGSPVAPGAPIAIDSQSDSEVTP